MTVKVSKPAINVREELADLRKPTGIAGEAMLRAETPQEQFQLIGAGRKNLLYNGDMKISQRGTSFTGVTHGTYTLDRWELNEDSAAEFTITQSSETPDGFGSSIKLDVTTADTSVGSAEYVVFEQRIEGYNTQSFGSGTSNAKPHTVSFWVRSNVTGTYICELKYDTGGYEASQAYTIDAADTWEYKVLVFPPQTLSAPANDNSAELRVSFWLLAGSNYTGGGTLSTQWTTTDNVRAVGQTNLVASTSNEIYFTGVQLELGKVATPFDHSRSYGEELAACQRYYFKSGQQWMSGQTYGVNNSQDGLVMPIYWPVTMRASPAISFVGGTDGGSGAALFSAFAEKQGMSVNLRSTNASNNVWFQPFFVHANAEL